MDFLTRFGFRTTPFTREIRTDHRLSLLLFDKPLTALERTVSRRMSAALIAPAGTGKTMLLRTLVAKLPEARYRARYVKTTDLSKRDMCREIAFAMDLPSAGSYPMLVRRIQEQLASGVATDGVCPVILIDDAHEFRPEVLGILRAITNFDMDSRLVVSIVLAGQTPLRALLQRANLEDVARRLSHYATLRVLSQDEIRHYIEHRCTVAGAQTAPFDASAFDTICDLGRGNLRATNSLALKGLETAADSGCDVVSSAHVLEARKKLVP